MSDGTAAEFGFPLHERVSCRARRLRIQIGHEGRVELVIPHGVPREEALRFVWRKRDWIIDRRAQALRRSPVVPPLRWNGHDRLLLGGVLRPLRHQGARLRRPCVRFGDVVEVLAPAAWSEQPERLTRLLRRELREHARWCAERQIGTVQAALPVRPSALRIADQKTRWGSCAADGTISLSWRLVMAPRPVFHYVVVHELCHLVHRNHSPRFWSLVARHMPDYAEHVAWLRHHGAQLQAHLPRRAPKSTEEP